MKTIEERAVEAYRNKRMEIHNLSHSANGELFNPILTFEDGYIQGATDQKAIDIDKAKKAFNAACGWLVVYPWYNGVFEEFVKAMEE